MKSLLSPRQTFVFVLGMLALCNPHLGWASKKSTRSVPSTMLDVDFQNHTYRPSCNSEGEGQGKIRVKKGSYENKKEELSFSVVDVVYGDIDGDGKEEAIVISLCNTGGTGDFTEGYVYALHNKKPIEIARIPQGDRAHGGLVAIRVKGQKVEIVRDATSDGATSYETQLVQQYQWNHNQLRPVGIGSRKTVDGKPITVREVLLEPGKAPMHIHEKSTDGGLEFVVPMKRGHTLYAKLTVAGDSKLVCYDPAGTFPATIGEDKPLCEMTAEEDGNYRILLYNDPSSEKPKMISLELGLHEALAAPPKP